jgi:uncharacterized membrane protein YeaQ/YmgE (transglycosylase-associated protein family)
MSLLLWVIFGGIVGWVASLIMKTDSQQGIILNVVVGIVGALLGGWVMNLMGQSAGGGINLYTFLVALLGSVILLAIVKAVRRA